MLKKMLIVFFLIVSCCFIGCAGRYGIPHHTAYNISDYQHLYTATKKGIELVPLTRSIIGESVFLAGKVIELGIPKIERVGGSSQHGYYDSFYKMCKLNVKLRNPNDSKEIVDIPIYIYFLYPRPADHHISEGDLIVIEVWEDVPDRKAMIFKANYVRNLSVDWRTYKLPIKE